MKAEIMRKSLKIQINDTCIHESAHVLIAYIIGMDINGVGIEWGRIPGDGRISTSGVAYITLWGSEELDAGVYVAGWAADVLINKKITTFYKSPGAKSDYEKVKKLFLGTKKVNHIKKVIFKEVVKYTPLIKKLAKFIYSKRISSNVLVTKKDLYKFLNSNLKVTNSLSGDLITYLFV